MITVPSSASPGNEIEVKVTSSSRIGETVTVSISDGMGGNDTVDVKIGDSGVGTAKWTVPNWTIANFADGVCDAASCAID
jgi:hypothetical protein